MRLLFTCIAICLAGLTFNTCVANEVSFQRTCDSGMLFLDGEYIVPPYNIEIVSQKIQVNDRQVAISLEQRPDLSDVASENENRERSRLGIRNASRRRGRDRERADQSPVLRAAQELEASLSNDGVVLIFSDAPQSGLFHYSDRFTFFETLLADKPSENQIREFVNLCSYDNVKDRWATMARTFTPQPELRKVMQDFVDSGTAREALQNRKKRAAERLDAFSYPLVLAGMMLGVVAFGHSLQWISRHESADSANDVSPITMMLVLMFAMSAVDLIWTILAIDAGVMRETNPVASIFLNSPIYLAVFKLVATGVTLTILYCWRARRQIQQATWWLCLVCVLLTFRWVVFNSMIS